MRNPFISFSIKAIVFLTVAFCLHITVLNIFNNPMFENRIILSYTINLILVIVIFGILYFLKEKYKSQLGFFFLAGSFLKFAVFFMVFYPFYKQDNIITRLEFVSFFVPYTLGLIIESISLIKWFNKLD